ncbi:FtsH protease activity modulator HflK [Halieaceae bacterium IMCC14734]|uniref:Protein HflK n=1 Tax=Candidatus Litorirhabdus singularis TaxID=2518993 RepID=A0ABT3TKB1_9GAMM|nr:FtsH protease activity modulator HflK [Candidatus Litorirhabdus singularis]MCX2982732.1 FtsH protease activity modulator HflK [Candidatus Litorirhabdus singularis]
MAWNEPGGNDNKPRDPWGGGEQGPPDLDEALRKLQEKLGGLFGGGKSGGGGSGGPSAAVSGGMFVILLLVAAVVWALMGLYTVDEQERGVVLRFGKYYDTVQPGLRWNPPLIDDVTTVNVTRVNTVAHREQMLTEDENIVEVNLSVQYVIYNAENFVLEVRSPEVSLGHATESALRHVVGGSSMDYVLTDGREQLGIDVQQRLQDLLDNYGTGIQISRINIDEAKPPAEVQEAFDDVIKAREDEERVKNEAQAYSNGVIPVARGAAQRVLEEANAYKEQVVAEASGEAERFTKLLTEYRKAPEVTRQRLYLDALQTVYSNTSKVVVDVEGGNNMLYLPLDKIVNQSSSGQAGRGSSDLDVRELTNRVVEQIRRDSAERNSRGGR